MQSRNVVEKYNQEIHKGNASKNISGEAQARNTAKKYTQCSDACTPSKSFPTFVYRCNSRTSLELSSLMDHPGIQKLTVNTDWKETLLYRWRRLCHNMQLEEMLPENAEGKQSWRMQPGNEVGQCSQEIEPGYGAKKCS